MYWSGHNISRATEKKQFKQIKEAVNATNTLVLHTADQSFSNLIYGLRFPPLLLEFTATHSSESIKQLAAGVSSFFF